MRKFGLWMAGVGFRYQAAVKHAKKELGDDDMSLLNFDWHHNIKELGAHMAVQARHFRNAHSPAPLRRASANAVARAAAPSRSGTAT